MNLQPHVLLALATYDYRLHRGIARYAGQHAWHLNADMCFSGHCPVHWTGNGILVVLDHREDLAALVRSAPVPVVDLSLKRPDIVVPRVIGDHYRIGVLAAEHLLEAQFSQFAFYSTDSHPPSELRWSGFADTLRAEGHPPLKWLRPAASPLADDPWPDKCQWLIQHLDALHKPAAVFAFCDADAAHVLDACLAARIVVPEEVAILGVDNIDLICETQSIPLSSVRHDLERIGYEAAALLDQLMQGKPAPAEPVLIPPCGLVVRRSTDVLALPHAACRRALKFLRTNFAGNIGVIDVARASGLPRRTLEKAFRDHLGRSIGRELSRIRLAKVKELLLQTQLPIVEVAVRTGYRTPQYLNFAFFKATGLTPGRFRDTYSPLAKAVLHPRARVKAANQRNVGRLFE